MNIDEVLSAPRSRWQRAYVERVIGSIHRECLNHIIVLNEESLRRTLRSYFSYYHRSRLHLSLDRDSPEPRPVQSVGRVVAFPEVGGLHHRYERVAQLSFNCHPSNGRDLSSFGTDAKRSQLRGFLRCHYPR